MIIYLLFDSPLIPAIVIGLIAKKLIGDKYNIFTVLTFSIGLSNFLYPFIIYPSSWFSHSMHGYMGIVPAFAALILGVIAFIVIQKHNLRGTEITVIGIISGLLWFLPYFLFYYYF